MTPTCARFLHPRGGTLEQALGDWETRKNPIIVSEAKVYRAEEVLVGLREYLLKSGSTVAAPVEFTTSVL